MARIPRGTTLTGKHMVAIAKLGRGEKPTQIAQDMGIDVGTIYSWQKWPLFQERLAGYVDSLSRQALDTGLEDAQVTLKEQATSIILWMTDIVLGKTELKDHKRWRMALDLLHHAGLIDQQQAIRAQQNPSSLTINNLNQDKRQQVLAVANQDLQDRFSPPPKRISSRVIDQT